MEVLTSPSSVDAQNKILAVIQIIPETGTACGLCC